jgi:anti-sigma factor RsiW
VECSTVARLLPCFLDGELDLLHHQQVEHHLQECVRCGEESKQGQALRAMMRQTGLYHRAPARLRRELEALAADGATSVHVFSRRWNARPWLNAAAAVLLLALVGAVLFWRPTTQQERKTAEEVVANHVRSLQVDHLTDVAAGDVETLKVWFLSKVGLSVEVVDLSAQGFLLRGGRLDYLERQVVAVLVYAKDSQVVNVSVGNAEGTPMPSITAREVRGVQVRHWNDFGMNYWASAELQSQSMDAFVKVFRDHLVHACMKGKQSE